MSSDTSPSGGSDFRPHDYYQLYRGYIEHEDDLINHRLTWLIYLETALFALFGLALAAAWAVLAKQAEILPNARDQLQVEIANIVAFGSLFAILCTLFYFGIELANAAEKSVRAAMVSLRNLAREGDKVTILWQQRTPGEVASIAIPFLAGGCGPEAEDVAKMGFELPTSALIALRRIWRCFLLIAILSALFEMYIVGRLVCATTTRSQKTSTSESPTHDTRITSSRRAWDRTHEPARRPLAEHAIREPYTV
jgi:hypothetical protein